MHILPSPTGLIRLARNRMIDGISNVKIEKKGDKEERKKKAALSFFYVYKKNNKN